MKNLILTVIITLCTITTFAQPAQYTPMTAAGYQMKRLKVDSTLHLPSFCGVPTIRGSVAKDGALAIDTCGTLLYMWTRLGGWDTINVSGGGSQNLQSVLNTGNTSLNKDISLYGKSTANQVYISGMDNNFMPFIALGDSIGGGIYQYTYPKATIEFINKYMSQKLKGQDSTRSIIYLPVQTIDATDTLAKLSDVRAVSTTPTLQQVTTQGAVSTNNITVNGLTLGSLVSGLDFTGNTNQLIISNRGTSDNLLEINYGATGSLKFGGGTYPYVELINNPDNNVGLQVPSTGGTIPISVNGYTANIAGNITIPAGGNDTTKVPYTGATKNVNIGTHDLFTNKVYLYDESNDNYGSIHYTDGDFHVEDADNHKLLVIEDGFMQLHLNDTIQSNIFTTSLTQVRNHTLPDKSGTFALTSDTVSLSNRINLKLNSTDTASLSNRINLKLNTTDTASLSNRINLKLNTTDTASLSNRINLKLNTTDTASLSNRINLKLNTADTSSLSNRINLKLNFTDTASLSNRINLKLNIADTSALQRKSISAYTILANKTSATANVTAQAFRDTSGVYDGTITWTGTTAPSGTTNHTYRLTQVGKCVTINISLLYATNGLAISKLTATLPSNAPTPVQPTGLTSALQNIYVANGQYITSTNTTANTILRSTLRNNTANNGFEFLIEGVSNTVAQVNIICQYWTN